VVLVIVMMDIQVLVDALVYQVLLDQIANTRILEPVVVMVLPIMMEAAPVIPDLLV